MRVSTSAYNTHTQAGVADRCQAKSFNFFTEPVFPTGYDVITMGFILHDWGIEKKLSLMKKVRGGFV